MHGVLLKGFICKTASLGVHLVHACHSESFLNCFICKDHLMNELLQMGERNTSTVAEVIAFLQVFRSDGRGFMPNHNSIGGSQTSQDMTPKIIIFEVTPNI